MTEVLAIWSVHFCLGSLVSTAMPTIQSSSRNTTKILETSLISAWGKDNFPDCRDHLQVKNELPYRSSDCGVQQGTVEEKQNARQESRVEILVPQKRKQEPHGQVDYDRVQHYGHDPS